MSDSWGGGWRELYDACRQSVVSEAALIAERRSLLSLLGPGGRGAEHATGADWKRLARAGTTVFEDVAPAIYLRLSTRAPDLEVPELVASYLAARDRNRALLELLTEVLETLNAREIPVITLKGSHLLLELHDDLGSRRMRDIDLLVPAEALGAAEAALLSRGFGPPASWRPSVEWCLREAHTVEHLYMQGLRIDLHWTLESPRTLPSLDIRDAWTAARWLEAGHRHLQVFSHEHTAIHFALHAAVQGRLHESLKGYLDLALWVDRFGDRIDWTACGVTASKWQVARLVGAAFEVASLLFRTPRPFASEPTFILNDFDASIVEIAEAEILTRREQPSDGPSPRRRLVDGWVRGALSSKGGTNVGSV